MTGTMGKPREFKTDKPFFELGPEDCFVKDFLRRLSEKRVQPTTKKRKILADPANTKLDILVKMAPCYYSRRSLQQARDGSSAGSSPTSTQQRPEESSGGEVSVGGREVSTKLFLFTKVRRMASSLKTNSLKNKGNIVDGPREANGDGSTESNACGEGCFVSGASRRTTPPWPSFRR